MGHTVLVVVDDDPRRDATARALVAAGLQVFDQAFQHRAELAADFAGNIAKLGADFAGDSTELAADIVFFDALITNIDRTPRNPNMLTWHGKTWLIDHGAAFYRQHGAAPLAETATVPTPVLRDHVLLPAAGPLTDAADRLTKAVEDAIEPSLALVPDFLLIVIGYLICRYTALDRPLWDGVEKLVYYLLFPVLLFMSILKQPLQPGALLPFAGCGVAVVACGIVLAYALRHGRRGLQAAVSAGQYAHADGLFYGGSAPTCVDIDECRIDNGGCGSSLTTTCTNTSGGRTCSCATGYGPADGGVCGDVDECATGNGGCSANAACTNTPGGRTCACNSGYSGDGVSCTDINECLSNNGGCSANAACTNTPGRMEYLRFSTPSLISTVRVAGSTMSLMTSTLARIGCSTPSMRRTAGFPTASRGRSREGTFTIATSISIF